MISVDEALAHILAARPGLKTESVPIEQAAERRLAELVQANVSRPPAAVSAMDGYALHMVDVAAPGAALKVIGEAPAGAPFAGAVNTGETVRIFTGGEIPSGADTVVMQEHVTRDGGMARFDRSYDAPQFVRAAGLDFVEGAPLLQADTVLGPAQLAVAAAANHGKLIVYKRPVVALLANGDELKPPGTPLSAGQIVNSNPAALKALITAWGGEAIDLGIASDSIASIRSHIERAAQADIIVPVGGASVGDHDYMRAAFAEAGFELVFEKIAVKPGKPTWMAAKGDQRVLGLPGNPASALVCAHLFLRPLMYACDGLATSSAPLSAPISANGPREHFMRGVLEDGKVRALPNQDSSLLTPFLTANCLIRRAAGAEASDVGDQVDILAL